MLRGYLALKQFRKDLLRVKSPGDLSFMTVFDTTATTGRQRASRDGAARAEDRSRSSPISRSSIDRGNYYRNRPDANTEFFTGDGESGRRALDQRSDDQWAVGFVRIPGGVAFFRTQPFVPARGSLTFGPHTDAVGIVQEVGERLVWESGRGWFPLQMVTGGTSKVPAVGLESGTLFPIRGRELNGVPHAGRTSTSLLQHVGRLARGERVVERAAERPHGRARAPAAGRDGARRRAARHRYGHDEGVRPRRVQRLTRRRADGARVRKDGRRARRARRRRPLHDDGSLHGGPDPTHVRHSRDSGSRSGSARRTGSISGSSRASCSARRRSSGSRTRRCARACSGRS